MDWLNPRQFSDEEKDAMCGILLKRNLFLKVVFNNNEALVLNTFLNTLELGDVEATGKGKETLSSLDPDTLAPIAVIKGPTWSVMDIDKLYKSAVCVVEVTGNKRGDRSWMESVYWVLLYMMVCDTPISKILSAKGRSPMSIKVAPPVKSTAGGISDAYPYSAAAALLPFLQNNPWVNYSNHREPLDDQTHIITARIEEKYMAYVVFNKRGDAFVVTTFCLLRGDSMVYGGKFLLDSMKKFARSNKVWKIVMSADDDVATTVGFKKVDGVFVLELRKKMPTRIKCCTIA